MIGKKIKDLRLEKNISQEQLGKILNVSTSMIGMYEIDARNPSYEVLNKLADYFDVTTDYLLDRTDKRNFDNKESIQQLKEKILKVLKE